MCINFHHAKFQILLNTGFVLILRLIIIFVQNATTEMSILDDLSGAAITTGRETILAAWDLLARANYSGVVSLKCSSHDSNFNSGPLLNFSTFLKCYIHDCNLTYDI